jgi:hypothetical protein
LTLWAKVGPARMSVSRPLSDYMQKSTDAFLDGERRDE